VTAGGLIFTGTRDRKVRALDSATGKVLWEAEVGAALEGMPSVYQIDGREYVVFCAAAQATAPTHDLPGQPAVQEPIPGAYIAFTFTHWTGGTLILFPIFSQPRPRRASEGAVLPWRANPPGRPD